MAATSRFTPNSFFFTDPTALTQSTAQAFGPESENIYRLTSKFSFAADTNTYAICSGVVLVQPQTGNSGLVNLILRPFQQPITGFNIKYFIYRGLNIGDFFDGANVIAASDDASDFINKINTSFTAYYTSTGTTPPTFLASFIGFDPTNQPATTLISDLFFKITGDTETPQTAFELPLIAAGASLGTFASGECGLDIVLDYGDYKLPTSNDQFVFDLNYARITEAKIDITNVSGDFQQQLLKEQIFQFLDAAAFYGFHVSGGTVNLNNDGTTVANTGEDIYNSVILNFSTKNNFYLYIQSDRTRSYNFYGNYAISDSDDNCLLTGYSADALSEQDYETNGWPVIILSTTQSISDPNIVLYIQFVTDNNDNTVLYGQVGQILNAQGNNFSGPDDLQQDIDADGSQPNLTKVFQLSNPAIGTDSSKSYISTFNFLIYQGAICEYVVGQLTDNNGQTFNATNDLTFLDQIFEAIAATPQLKSNENTDYAYVTLQRIKLVNSRTGNKSYGVSAIETLIINDSVNSDSSVIQRVFYVTNSTEILNDGTSVTGTIPSATSSMPSVSDTVDDNSVYNLPSPYFIKFQQFTDDSIVVNGLQLSTSDNSVPNKYIIGLLKSENDTLLALIDNIVTNPRIYIANASGDDTYIVSAENINYKKYSAGIIAETSAGNLELLSPANNIYLYTLDELYYFTQNFAATVTTDLSTVFGDIAIELNSNLS